MVNDFMTDQVSVRLVNWMGNDNSVAQAARVSTIGENAMENVNTMGGKSGKNAGLINYLMRDRHGSPFEHNSFTFMVSAPMVVFWQMVRHRVGWSYNLESARYRELGKEFYVPGPDRPLQQVGKPGAYNYVAGNDEQRTVMLEELLASYEQVWSSYQRMLGVGICREVARLVLPFGVYFHGYATCNARSLMHFLSLRTKAEGATVVSSPQHEINAVADLMEAEWAKYMPLTHMAFNDNGRVAP